MNDLFHKLTKKKVYALSFNLAPARTEKNENKSLITFFDTSDT